MKPNTLTLIRSLQSTSHLDGRYTNITVVNRDPNTGEKIDDMGVLSVVFRAHDLTSGNDVAIKFLDPDIDSASYTYRNLAFLREFDLLSELKGRSRCLQLVSDSLSNLDIDVTDVSGTTARIRCIYFIVEWIAEPISPYFLSPTGTFTPKEKLQLFRNITLAVFELHRNNIVHRDLKIDNFRKHTNGRVIAIDLGTSRKRDGTTIGALSDYDEAVGSNLWAPLEMFLGIGACGQFELFRRSDLYALGCFLFQLFNSEHFKVRQVKDSGFNNCLSDCHRELTLENPSKDKLLDFWNKIISTYGKQVTPPSIADSGSTVPASAAQILDRLLHLLTHIDHRYRNTSQDHIIARIDTAIRIIDNQRLTEKRFAEKQKRRRQRIQKRQRRLEKSQATES